MAAGAGMKRLAKETVVYGLSNILGRFLNWLLVPMYVRVLSDIGEFGIYTNLYAWVALLLVLLTYGMETGLFRFINRRSEEGHNPDRVYATTLYSIAATSIAFFLLTLLCLDPISKVLNYHIHPEFLGMMAGVAALDALCSIPFAYLRYKGKAMRFMAIRMLNIGLNIFLNIFLLIICPWIWAKAPETIGWFYSPTYGVGYVFVANVITTLITFIVLIPDMAPGLKAKGGPDPKLLKRMLRYSLPILVLGIAGIFNQTADKILFPFLFFDQDYANEQLGIYGACFKIAVVMVMFTHSFRYAYEPFVFARHSKGDGLEAYPVAMKFFIILALGIFLGVMFYLDALKYFVSPACYPGLRVVPIVMLGELFYGIYYNLSVWYKLSDNTQWGAYFSIAGCVVTVGIILIYAPVYEYMACAWASPACNGLMMVLSYFVGRKKFPVSYDIRSAAIYALLAAALYAAGMFVEIDNPALRMIWRTGLLAIFALFVARKEFGMLKPKRSKNIINS
ncbi:MAG: oligosaccharide flippase family protein [Tannerellaceae bacterium]|jgi:O-antigen/teichoic acid export membrane protein|nr:oligosaccharide flippase family protein [Tannerellaceae bacterium]